MQRLSFGYASMLSHSCKLAAKFRPYPDFHIGCLGQHAKSLWPKTPCELTLSKVLRMVTYLVWFHGYSSSVCRPSAAGEQLQLT